MTESTDYAIDLLCFRLQIQFFAKLAECRIESKQAKFEMLHVCKEGELINFAARLKMAFVSAKKKKKIGEGNQIAYFPPNHSAILSFFRKLSSSSQHLLAKDLAFSVRGNCSDGPSVSVIGEGPVEDVANCVVNIPSLGVRRGLRVGVLP